MEFFYRFRSTDALLDGKSELENQDIYFASPDQLNDPMEGFKDVFWSGDRIVWANLLKHYVLCLMQSVSLIVVMGKDYQPNTVENIVFRSESNLPTPKFRDIYLTHPLIFLGT